MVVPSLYSALDEAGRFLLPSPAPQGLRPIVSETRAVELGVAWTVTWGPIADAVASMHGRAIDWGEAQLAWRSALFALSPVEEVTEDVPIYVVRYLGPQYHIRFVSDAGPIATVSVAAHSTDLDIVDGRIVLPRVSGEEFSVTGIPLESKYHSPLDPEVVISELLRDYPVRVSAIPRLVHPLDRMAPYYGRWELRFDCDVMVRAGDNGLRPVRTVYARTAITGGRVAIEVDIPLESQPDTIVHSFLRLGEPPSIDTVRVARRADMPVFFEQVEVESVEPNCARG